MSASESVRTLQSHCVVVNTFCRLQQLVSRVAGMQVKGCVCFVCFRERRSVSIACSSLKPGDSLDSIKKLYRCQSG